MKSITQIAACIALIASAQGAQALKLELEGFFYMDGETMECSIQNSSKTSVVIEGLKDEMLKAEFYSRNNVAIPAKTAHAPDSKLFQEWTRLLAASPDGANPGSVYRLIMYYSNLPDRRREEIDYLVFEAKVYQLSPDNRLSEGGRVKIRLKNKKKS